MDEIKAAINNWAAGYDCIRRVFLFGSRIRGTNKDGGEVRPDSDLDIAIEIFDNFDQETLLYWQDHATVWRDQLRDLVRHIAGWPIQLECYHRDWFPKTYDYVTDSGVVIYISPHA
jgi:predicted nucleotidyltransferase